MRENIAGQTERCFGKLPDIIGIPNLVAIQRKSYDEFLQRDVAPTRRKPVGLEALFRETFPIESYDKKMLLEYLYYELEKPHYTPNQCRQLRLTYGYPLKIWCRLRSKEGEDPDALVIVDGVPRAGIDLRFDLDFEPAEDWWPRGILADRPREVVPGRPVVEVLFGVRDVDCAKQADPTTDADVLTRPMRALAVRLEPGRVAVMELVEFKK